MQVIYETAEGFFILILYFCKRDDGEQRDKIDAHGPRPNDIITGFNETFSARDFRRLLPQKLRRPDRDTTTDSANDFYTGLSPHEFDLLSTPTLTQSHDPSPHTCTYTHGNTKVRTVTRTHLHTRMH